ncbi:hypothetical protein V6N13_136505 [Hibiscus sabdariffa]|uniref:Neprosin activation peptide domain-containing protein n=1 Tax=Hibiscus sabdariffa TaxID=183260 RepID=A0ABR2DPB3_9ROSI
MASNTNIIVNKRGVLFRLLFSLVFMAKFDLISGLNYTKYSRKVSSLRLERIQKHLENINKPAVITIEKVAPVMPKVKMLKEYEEKRGEDLAWQMWHRNGTRCPKGTVPIRRSTTHDVLSVSLWQETIYRRQSNVSSDRCTRKIKKESEFDGDLPAATDEATKVSSARSTTRTPYGAALEIPTPFCNDNISDLP